MPNRDLKKVFLDDLQEFEVSMGPWRFGKRGYLGDGKGSKIVVNGKPAMHGLSMHPPSQGAASVKYRLGKNARTFAGVAALNDSSKSPPPCKFIVAGAARRSGKPPCEPAAKPDSAPSTSATSMCLSCASGATEKDSWAQGVWLDPHVLKP